MNKIGKKKILTIVAVCVAAGAIGTVLMGMVQVGGGGGGGMGGPGGGMGRSGATGEDQPPQKTVVEAETPVLGDIAVTGTFVGTVEPGQQITVYPKASGEVLEANYSVGDRVEAGAVLFRLDSSTLELDIAQAQATLRIKQAEKTLALETAQRNLENYTNNIDDGLNSTLLKAESDVRSAENALEQANISYRTARDNYYDYLNNDWEGEYSDSTLESLRNAKVTAELKVESSQLALENAKASLAATKKQVEEQRVTTESGVKSAELGADFSADYISIEKLQKNLSNYTSAAPISGIIEQKNIDVYDTASAQTAAYVISNRDLFSISFNVAESALNYLKPGDSVTVEKSGETCTGTITEVATMVDSASGLYTVKASVENAPFELRSGSTVKLIAQTQKVENGMIVPIDAVYYDNGSPYVFVFDNNAARKIEVEVGISDERYIHILSGLSQSDQVIVTWSSSLYDGAEVYLPGTAPQEDVSAALPEGSGNPADSPEGGNRPQRKVSEEAVG